MAAFTNEAHAVADAQVFSTAADQGPQAQRAREEGPQGARAA